MTDERPQPTLLAPKAAEVTQSAPRHAHKRSAAVSHDFGLDKSVLEPLQAEAQQGPQQQQQQDSSAALSSLRLPVPTFASSSSSLPLQSAYSLASSSTSSLQDTNPKNGQPLVSFAVNRDKPQTSSEQHVLQSKRHSRHKKVKSWAGNLIKLRSSKRDAKNSKQQPGIVETPEMLHQFTSSYVTNTTRNNKNDPGPIIEPMIDLDAALGPFRTPQALSSQMNSTINSTDGLFSFHHQQHRRSESAPEISPGILGMKRKMGPLLEEDSIEESVEESASSSAISLVSSSRLSAKRTGYSRSYKTALSALSAASLGSHGSAASSQTSLVDRTVAIPPVVVRPATPSDTTASPRRSNDDSIMTILPVSQQPSAHLDKQQEVNFVSSEKTRFFSLGEPGPEVRISLDSVNMSIPSSPAKSYKGRRSQDSHSSSSISMRRNVAKRAWRWVRNKVSGDSLQE